MEATLNLGSTMGVALIGVVVASAFYGVSVLQAYYYYTHQTDTWLIKMLVGLVMLFETVHQGLITHCIYVYLVSYFSRPEMLGQLVWSLLVEVLFNGLTAFLVQSFLTMRVWKFSNRRIWLTGLLVLLIAGEFGCIIAYTILSLRLRTYLELGRLKGLSIAVNVLAAAGDLVIAASLCVILHQSRTGFKRSDTMIKKLIVYSVNTGLLTSLCAVASLISIVFAGHTFLYIMFFFCIGRLYSNSLLAALNSRKKIRAAAETTSENLSLSLQEFPRNGGISMATKPLKIPMKHVLYIQHSANISIKINTEEFNTELIQECDRNDLGHARQGLDEKRSGIGMAFARKISSSSTTTFADSPVIQPV